MPPASNQNREARRRPGGRAAVVRAAVRHATFTLLEEVGYDRFQLPDVAARAGVNKTTVYRRWPTKLDLLAELFTDLTASEAPTPDTGSLTQDMEILLREISDLLDLPAVRAVLGASISGARDDESMRATLRTFWDHRFKRASVIVERAIGRDELPAGTNARGLLEAIFGPLYLRKLIVGQVVDEAYLKQLAALRVGPTPSP